MSMRTRHAPGNYSNTRDWARVVHRYAYRRRIAAVILLVASIAAIVLTSRRTAGKPETRHAGRGARPGPDRIAKWPPRKDHDHADPRADIVPAFCFHCGSGIFLNRKNVIVL